MKYSKLIFPFALLAISGLAFSANTHINSGTQVINVKAKSGINCYQHNTDICIDNQSWQPVTFSIPAIGQSGTVYPNQAADSWSNAYYSCLNTSVWNSYGQLIFNQCALNHSIIQITNYGKDNKELRVKVIK